MPNLPVRTIGLILWIVCNQISATFALDILKLPGANDIGVVPYLYEYVDCTCQATSEEILEKWDRGAFEQLEPARVVNRGVTNCHHWFALRLRNDSPYRENYLWGFYNDGIRFTLYEVDVANGNVIREEKHSHMHPFSAREVPLRSISFLLPMESGETKHLLLKTELYGRQNLYFPTDISTRSDILTFELEFSFLLGRYYGFFFFAIIFNLSLFVLLRKRFYGMMLGYILSLLAFNMVEYLHDVYLVPDILYAWWSRIPKLVFLGLMLFFNVYVFMSFVQQEKYFPRMSSWMDRLNSVVLGGTVVFGILHIASDRQQFLHLIQVLFVVLLMGQTLFMLVQIITALIKRTPYILHYILGNFLLFASVLLYLSNAFNILYLPQFVRPGNIIFAFGVEVVYLMIVFTIKYKQDFDRFTVQIAKGEEKRTSLTAELVSVQEKERQRIAQDIHDGIGGTLQGLRLLLEAEELKGKDKVGTMLQDINADFRNLLHQISPRGMDTNGLFETIRQDIARRVTGLTIDFSCVGDDMVLPKDIQINIYRIYQELLTNALKHGDGVNVIDISLSVDGHEIRLLVEDDGKDCAASFEKSNGGMGLKNVTSRVEYYGGSLEIDLSKNGCSILVIIPINRKEKE